MTFWMLITSRTHRPVQRRIGGDIHRPRKAKRARVRHEHQQLFIGQTVQGDAVVGKAAGGDVGVQHAPVGRLQDQLALYHGQGRACGLEPCRGGDLAGRDVDRYGRVVQGKGDLLRAWMAFLNRLLRTLVK